MLVFPAYACAEELTEESVAAGVDEMISALDMRELEELFTQYGFGNDGNLKDAVKEVSLEGLKNLTPDDALGYMRDTAAAALKANIGTAVQLVIMLAITGVLSHLGTSFGKEGTSQAAGKAGYIIVCGLAVSMLAGTVLEARTAMEKLFSLTEVLTPVLVTLLTGVSGSGTAAAMSPVMAALTGSVAALVKNVIFPVILVAAVLGAVSNISSTVRLSRASALLMSFVKWALGLVMVVFLGVAAMKGLTASAIDGLSYKTAKYTVGKAIPYVGGLFSESLDTIMACALLVKNAVGVIGLIMMAALMAAPILKVLVSMFLFKAAAAAAQPFSDANSVAMLSQMGETVKLTAIVLLTCTAMVFITVSLFIGSADMGMAMR